MKLKEFLNETLHKSTTEHGYQHDDVDKFDVDIIKSAMTKAKKLKSYKDVIAIATENTTTRQESNGSMSFAVEGTNGYYFTISGNLRYYGSKMSNTMISHGFGDEQTPQSKTRAQGRLSLNDPIKSIITFKKKDDDIIDQLVKRYDNLLKSLLRVIKKKVVTEGKVSGKLHSDTIYQLSSVELTKVIESVLLEWAAEETTEVQHVEYNTSDNTIRMVFDEDYDDFEVG